MKPAIPTSAPKTFREWFRHELKLELRLSAVFLVLGLAGVFAADKLWANFAEPWARLNYQLTSTALEQHPTALFGRFTGRLSTSEYGWGVFSWTAPFNVSVARQRLQADFPEFLGVDASGQAISALRRPHSAAALAARQERAAAYAERHRALEARRFKRLYPDDSPFNLPSATTRLARLTTKILGLPDATLHLFRGTLSSGTASFLLFSGTFALAVVAVWTSRRPARRWLKVLLCPCLASALAWVVILFMAIAAAMFGGFTPNTSALAVFAGAPLMFLIAKTPLRFLEDLQLKPKPWDGVDRRRNPRPPMPPAPTGSVPPVGGA